MGSFQHCLVGLLFLITSLTSVNVHAKKKSGREVSFTSDITALTAIAGQTYSKNLKDLLKKPGVGTLVWNTSADIPPWLTLDSANGKLTGTPSVSEVGTKSFRLSVQDSEAGAVSRIDMTVILAPFWIQDPLFLGKQPVGKKWDFDLSTLVQNMSGVELTFSTENPEKLPRWMSLDPKGKLSGTPNSSDIGAYRGITFVVSDPSGNQAKAMAEGEVTGTASGPTWMASSFTLENATEGFPYSQDISGSSFVANPNVVAISFSLIGSVPKWLRISATGKLFGKPEKTDVGTVSVTARLSATMSGSVYTSDTTLKFSVLRANHSPVWSLDPVILPDTKANALMNRDLSGYAMDPDGDALTFKIISGPKWTSLSPKGVLSGTPDGTNAGMNEWVVTASDAEFAAKATIKVKVIDLNHPPKWVQDPVVLNPAKENAAYSANLAPFAMDPDAGSVLSFQKLGGPSWLAVNKSGLVGGFPKHGDLGLNSFSVRVLDSAGQYADATLRITVNKVNHAPIWTEGLLKLGKITENTTLSFDLSRYAKDEDGDSLSFRLVKGPSWLSVNPKGLAAGTPKHGDIGDFTAVFEVSDGMESKQAGGQGTVLAQIYPPKLNQAQLNFTIRERQEFTEDLNQSKYVTDPQGLKITFIPQAAKDWVKFTRDGKIALSPKFKDIGKHEFKFQVSNSKAAADGSLNVTVIRDPRPPVWLQNPVTFKANARLSFTSNLSEQAMDLDGLQIFFSKKAGPSWLAVDSNGKIHGTPPDNAVGPNSFVVTVRNDMSSAEGNVVITVASTNHPPVWLQDPIELPQAIAGNPYKSSLTYFAKDVDNDPLVFKKDSGPDWITLAPDGKITGIPPKKTVGKATLRVRITDPSGAFAVATVNIEVKKPNLPPKWVKDPIPLADATEGKMFAFDLSAWAIDENGDPLTFKKVTDKKFSGSSWLSVSPSGTISGTPTAKDVGAYTAVFSVSNGKFEVQVGAVGKVIGVSPIIHPENLKFAVKERETFKETLSQAKFVEDNSGRPLDFKLRERSGFVSLTPKGSLTISPAFSHIGTHKFSFEVSNGILSTNGDFTVVVSRDPRPPSWTENPVKLPAMTKLAFVSNLSDKVKDLDGRPVTFAKKSGPDWLTVKADGQISGTPTTSDVGENTFLVVAANDVLSAEGKVIISVVADNHPPIWLQDPIDLTPATVSKSYAQKVDTFATDPDGDPITFSKAAGPSWLFVTTSGLLIGVPQTSDLGLNSIKVRATDPKGAFTDATVRLSVTSTGGMPPKWKKDPIDMGPQKVGVEFIFDLSAHTYDSKGNALSYRKLSGPNWFTVSNKGLIKGTPAGGDVGEYSAAFEVNNGMATSEVRAFGRVLLSANHPVILALATSFTVKVHETLSVDLNQPKYVHNPDGSSLQFGFLACDKWVSLDHSGKLQASPTAQNQGTYTYTLVVKNAQGLSDQKNINLEVIADIKPPRWTANPVHIDAKINQAIGRSLTGYVEDPSGKPITFTKRSGPDWLTVETSGSLFGNPTASHLGTNSFLISASNGAATAEATLVVEVRGTTPVSDKIVVDDPVVGAATANLWVVDNLWPSLGKNKLIRQLNENIQIYNETLDRAQIHHTGILISSIAGAPWNGLPVEEDSTPLMTWNDASWARHFQSRLNTIQTKRGKSSPLWAMLSLYTQAPSLPIFGNTYFTPGVPMEVMIVTGHRDLYSHYAKQNPQGSWKPNEYAENFIQLHKRWQIPYRINVIAPLKSDGSALHPLTQATKGQFYGFAAGNGLEGTLIDYARKVAFRANIAAKQKIELKNRPSDGSGIRVYLAEHELEGNKGGLNDVWSFDGSSGNGVVLMRWDRIDLSTINSGDILEIRYAVR